MLIQERLLDLQAVDTATTQLQYRRAHLPELDAAAAARAAMKDWEQRRAALAARLDELSGDIEAAERESADIDTQRARLQAQLRTVIAPREAEALQHQIATLGERRSELDDRGLAALEEQSDVDDTLQGLLADEASVRSALEVAEEALTAAQASVDSELAELDARRTAARAELADSLLQRYDRLRAQHGVAVARLVGTRCDGCHLDLSAVELDGLKAVPEGEFGDCPQCGRLLVR